MTEWSTQANILRPANRRSVGFSLNSTTTSNRSCPDGFSPLHLSFKIHEIDFALLSKEAVIKRRQ